MIGPKADNLHRVHNGTDALFERSLREEGGRLDNAWH
jgi:hypothetical protein